MCTYSICFITLLAAVVLVPPVECATNEEPRTLEEPLCPFVRSAASQSQLEREAIARPREVENLDATAPDLRTPLGRDKSSLANYSNSRADRELFESSLVDWPFFEDLAREQQAILWDLLTRCGCKRSGVSIPASVFGQFNVSQRATFVSITHAMLNTHLVDREDGKDLGDVLQLIEGMLDLRGENIALPSDQQFQLIARLAPGALQRLDHAANFERGENHVFHKGYPISFRQFRRIGRHGSEAGLHISLVPDGRIAEIHIDYRFGLLHLGPSNADVRAPGNHEKHVDRWPNFGFVVRLVRVRRAVLQ
jgi:hypothetical protein